MLDPVSLSVALISAVGTIIIGIIQLLNNGLSCSGSNCCTFSSSSTDVHDNETVQIRKSNS